MPATARFIVLGLLLAIGTRGDAPPAPRLPRDLPQPRTPEWGAEQARGPGRANAPLGVGHLRPADEAPNAGHDWLANTLLPLYRGPDGPHWGWLAHGWLLSNDGSTRPFPSDCLVETSYESSSMILTEWRDDGWFRIAGEKPCVGESGGEEALWSHRSLLDLGEHELTAQLWPDFFFLDEVSPLSFRQPEIPHALRSGPSADTERITWIGAAHSMEPLQVAGDWMRVRVTQPSNYCISPEDWEGVEHEGWVRWRDQEKGPWVFIWSRGC